MPLTLTTQQVGFHTVGWLESSGAGGGGGYVQNSGLARGRRTPRYSIPEDGVDLLPNSRAAIRLQVAHCAFHVAVPHPLLHGPQIYAAPQRPGCECCAEFMQPEVIGVQPGPLCYGFADIKKIELRPTSTGGKEQRTIGVGFHLPLPQCPN